MVGGMEESEEESDFEVVKRYYNYSNHQAEKALRDLSSEDIEELRQEMKQNMNEEEYDEEIDISELPSTPLIEKMIKQKNAAIVRLPTSDEVVSELVGLFMSLRKMGEKLKQLPYEENILANFKTEEDREKYLRSTYREEGRPGYYTSLLRLLRKQVLSYLSDTSAISKIRPSFLRKLFQMSNELRPRGGCVLVLPQVHDDTETRMVNPRLLEKKKKHEIQNYLYRIEVIRLKIKELLMSSETFKRVFKDINIMDARFYRDLRESANEYDLMRKFNNYYHRLYGDLWEHGVKEEESKELNDLTKNIFEIIHNELRPLLNEVFVDKPILRRPPDLSKLFARQYAEIPDEHSIIIKLFYLYFTYVSNDVNNYFRRIKEQIINELDEAKK